ncbi:serine/threonine-protein kinase [Mycobacterium conspicuum]|jgi:serine/threonine-protein kinase|nr:serine/threonine-protein kinase [Mycobacterium conspicuum]ORV33399.1 hypothetical protein AWC00_27570 [Mycobacterium conspicuum]
MSLAAGQVFAGYTIVRVLGAGAMGTVYLVSHPRLPRQDALKVLPADLTANPEFRARFLREAELAAGLSHPNIVRIHDRGEEDGQFWISMAYVAGTDAGRFLREQFPGGMPLDEVAAIIAAVASALDYAHHRGLLHRDVKPANILLADPDAGLRRVFLADFGIARSIDDAAGLTATNMTVGTVNYAAPEQLRGEAIDGRADQYALACTAFHLLTGAAPFEDSNQAVVISRHVNTPPPSIGARRPELAGLDAVFATAMAKDPSQRFVSCTQFAEHLRQQSSPGFAYAGEIPARPDTEVTQPSLSAVAPTVVLRSKRRRRGVLAGALAGAALLVAGAVFAGVKLIDAPKPVPVAAPHGSSAAPKAAQASAPNTGPFTGVYNVDFARVTSLEGQVPKGATPTTETWAVRSACGSAGCMATASRLSGDTLQVTSMVLDQVDGNWIAVSVGSTNCGKLDGEVWETFTLQPRPDGTLVGEATQTMAVGCGNKRSVTFTRTGDADLSTLPDPATLPPRVVSPAEGLRGRYHESDVTPTGFKEEGDYTVQTHCLRTGDRCMSFFHAPPSSWWALVFGGGQWVYAREFDSRCSKGGTAHVKVNSQFPLPQPAQNPIALLTGQGFEDVQSANGTNCGSTSVTVKFARTGD